MATTQEVLDALFRADRAVQTYRKLPAGLRRIHLYVLHALEALDGTARVRISPTGLWSRCPI